MAITPGPWQLLALKSEAGASYRVCGYDIGRGAIDIAHIALAWSGDGSNARLIATAPELDAAAGLAITALAFAQERYARDGDELALAQTTQAKNALIAAQKKARGGETGMRDVTPTCAAPQTLLPGAAS